MKRPDTFVSFDLETTGLDPNLHEIIEIGAVRVENGFFTAEFQALVKPTVRIPEFICSLTGITNGDVEHAPPVCDVIPEFAEFSRGYTLLGQNVGFDLSFLRKHGGWGTFGPAIDNIEFARIILPQIPAYNLDSLLEFFAIEPEKRHRGLDDAKVTAMVFLKLLNILRVMPPDFATEMHQIAERTGSPLAEMFESHIRERLEFRKEKAIQPEPVSPLPVMDNIFGAVQEWEEIEIENPAIDGEFISSHLADGGSLSRHHAAFEERKGQIQLCRKVAGAFSDSEILMAEAGTGIGKSIAYLLPALYWAENAHERVVISTNTKNLQEQLFNKDIPLLKKVLEFPFRAVILKGRGNYLCLNRWNRLKSGGDRFLSVREKRAILPVAAWLNSTRTGDLSETGFFPLVMESGLLEKINSDSPFCIGTRCKHRDECFVNRVRKAAQRSHLVIVNHSLVFSDMVSEGGVLGQYSRIVFDEAHNIEKVALQFLGVTMNVYRVRRVLNRLYENGGEPYGLLARLAQWSEEMVRAWPEFDIHRATIERALGTVETVRSAATRLFESLFSTIRADVRKDEDSLEGKLRYYENNPFFAAIGIETAGFEESSGLLVAMLGEVLLMLSQVTEAKLEDREEIMIELGELQGEVSGCVNDLAFLIEAGGRNVFWFEYTEDGSYHSLKIRSAPLDVAEKLASGLFDHMETVIMTSATLTVARDFSYFRNRLGVNLDTRDRAVEFIADSPFDYRRQAANILPSFLPPPKTPEYITGVNDLLYSLASNIGRGMLVLFTSKNHMLQSYQELKDKFTRMGVLLLAQDVDGSRALVLRRFQEETKSVLFGTDSFWEGIDVPGHALEIVVISKLPFSVPTDPLVQALTEEVARSGANPFMGYTVPEAAIKLRQGAGRLIRHRNDRGVVIICDTRIETTRYGSIFLKSLPGKPLRAESPERLVEQVKAWFGE